VSTSSSAGRGAIKSFVVERDNPGLKLDRLEHKLGIRASDTANFVLDNVRVPKENLLGSAEIAPKGGFAGVMQTFDNTRPLVAGMAIGVGRACLDRTRELLSDAGIEVDIWKIEGVDLRGDAEMLAEQTRKGTGREGVVCVVLGRGASTEKVEHWLQAASSVDGFVGFAIGRSLWWDAPTGRLSDALEREAAAAQIAENDLHFIDVYQGQQLAH